ncbi:lipid A deacylase LpxR family protein [Lacibacterium aquatile]|uniref:Lipid A deacylase LpxR family protein n=1 Tax=Lacibacterium aquatile TaxID=1168082 RepID=A0ABW5DYB9_9PROT
MKSTEGRAQSALWLLAMTGFLLAPNLSHAQETAQTPATVPPKSAPEPKKESGTLSLTVENDLFNNFDRHYTNGVQLSWLSSPDQVPSWIQGGSKFLFPDQSAARIEYALGQNMYTPKDITRIVPDADDRPYAGWLYGSVGIIAETGRQLDQLQLSLGVVGPAALAGETQKAVHKVTGSNHPQGWGSQLNNEPAIQLTYQRSLRAFATGDIWGMSIDATPHFGGALGNVFTYANGGGTLRFGYNLPDDYGPPRIQPSLPGAGYFETVDDFGWYLFAGFDGRAIARNMFLDGNTWTDSPSVDKKHFVLDAQAGIAVVWRDTRIAYTYIYRTREFDGQENPDQFGALSVSFRF